MRRFLCLVVPVATLLLVTACSDDADDDRSNPPGSSSAVTTTSASTTTATSPDSVDNAACALVTEQDAEAVFDASARRGTPDDVGEDAVCFWEAGDDGEGSYQYFEFRLHVGSSLRTHTTRDGGVVVTEQRAQDGIVYAFRYVSNGGDFEAKRAAVHGLADTVIERAS